MAGVAGVGFFFFRAKMTPTTMRPMTTRPPMTPPTMAPMGVDFLSFLLKGSGEGEVGEGDEPPMLEAEELELLVEVVVVVDGRVEAGRVSGMY